MTLTTKQLLQRLYFDRAYTETARIIGYGGIELATFWEQAKGLSISHGRMLNAVYDLTRGDRREETPPRYELSGPARDACWQLLGPPPEHPLYDEMHPPAEAEVTDIQPTAEAQWKGRKRKER